MGGVIDRVFIGSASEARSHAEALGRWVIQSGRTPLYWWDAFPVSGLFLESIERVPSRVIGAVMLATPDDDAEIRGKRVKVPRTNVLFETAYFAATLGRERVALCVYSDVELISDLQGFTHVRMGSYTDSPTPQPAGLGDWLGRLSTVVDGTTTTSLWHGYSGTWDISLTFSRWRGVPIESPSLVELEGTLQLHLPLDGRDGGGMMHGVLQADIREVGRARIRVADSVTNACFDLAGGLRFQSQTLARQIESKDLVAESLIDGLEPQLFAGTVFDWQLSPHAGRELRGSYRSTRSDALVTARKRQ